MTRTDDLAMLAKSDLGRVDLTPDGPLVAPGYGPWVKNSASIGCVHVEQVAGTNAMDVRLEGSNTGTCPVELCAFTELTGSGKGDMFLNMTAVGFLRLRVVSAGSGGQVTGTQVSR